MKIPIRMISIVVTLFWIILIGFFVTAVYSVKDVGFHLGEPEIHLTVFNETIISMPIAIDNQGYYNIGSFNLSTKIYDSYGDRITEGNTFIPVIEKGTAINARHNVTLDVDSILQNNQNYLFNDTELVVYETVGLALAEIIPVQASTNFSVPWGAPLYNFALGNISYTSFNGSHLTAIVPVSFVNHAFFDLNGNVRILLYNSTDSPVGLGEAAISAPQGASYQGEVGLTVEATEITEKGYCEVYISTGIFDFGPLVVSYG